MNSKEIIGTWISYPTDNDYSDEIKIDIKENGELIYTIMMDNKDQIILLNYRVENGYLITNQPSASKEEKTKYSIVNGKLELQYNNEKATFSGIKHNFYQ